MLTKEILAAALNNREYLKEISEAEAALAKNAGLVVIFGQSDDLCELRGAIEEELGAYGGTEIFFTKDGTLLQPIEDDEEEILRKHGVLAHVREIQKQAVSVKALWCAGNEFSWNYETTAPRATFTIMDDAQPYCQGIVIDLKELA